MRNARRAARLCFELNLLEHISHILDILWSRLTQSPSHWSGVIDLALARGFG